MSTRLMSAPANGEATISVDAAAPDTASGDGVAVSMDLTVMSSESRRKRAVATDCSLAVVIDGQTVYNSTILANGNSTMGITSSSVSVSDNPLLQIIETCGQDPVALVVSNVLLVAVPMSDTTSSTFPASITVPASGSVTRTATGSFSTLLSSSRGQVSPSLSQSSHFSATISRSQSSSDLPSVQTESGMTSFTLGNTALTSPSTALTSDATLTTTLLPTQTTSITGFPSVVGNFAFFGCVGSTNNFPTFELRASNQQMDIEQCTTICEDNRFAGIYKRYVFCYLPRLGTLD